MLGRKKLHKEVLQGFYVNDQAAFRRLADNQFGDVYQGGIELISNGSDAYGEGVPLEERRVDVHTRGRWISVSDYGLGMSETDIHDVLTMGATHKAGQGDTIGQFGSGFYSNFNASLGTRLVRITTRLEGEPFCLEFRVLGADRLPEIHTSFPKNGQEATTKVELELGSSQAVAGMVRRIRQHLHYSIVPVRIDGELTPTIWQEAKARRARFFSGRGIKGFVQKSRTMRDSVTLLCKYQRVGYFPLSHFFIARQANIAHNLSDYRRETIPYLPEHGVVVNADFMNLTISRDGFYLDNTWRTVCSTIRDALLLELAQELQRGECSQDAQLVNLYILASEVAQWLKAGQPAPEVEDHRTRVVSMLANAKLFRLYRSGLRVSLLDLFQDHSEQTPFFFSSNGMNPNWLGGSFRHKDVVLAGEQFDMPGVAYLLREILTTVFSKAVDLDRDVYNAEVLRELCKEGVVHAEQLRPEVQVVPPRLLVDEERALTAEVEGILQLPGIKQAIAKYLHLNIERIDCVMMDVEGKELRFAVGLLDSSGMPYAEPSCSNVIDLRDSPDSIDPEYPHCLQLALARQHKLIQEVLRNRGPYRALYLVSYLSTQLALCQRMLVPDSPMFLKASNDLANEMRTVLIDYALKQVA